MITNPKHAKWFHDWQVNGKPPVEAFMAIHTGYGKASAGVEVCRLKKKYADEIYEVVQSSIKVGSAKAFKCVLDIIENGKVSEAVRLKASLAILDYAGHKAAEKKEISIVDRTEEELDARLVQLKKELAIDAEIID